MRATRKLRRCGVATASILLLSMVSLAACGDESQSGDPKIPAGYKTYRGKLVSFAYPGDWRVRERPTASGPVIIVIQPPAATPPRATVQLNEDVDLRGTFDSVLTVQASVRKGSGGAGETTEDVDLEGAERAVRYEGTATIAGKRFDASGLSVLTKDGGGAFLSAVIPDGDAAEIDTIVGSLRLNGS